MQTEFSETSTIARNFQDEGFDRVDFEEVADMYVINTCSVTENADKQFKQVVKKAMKLNNKLCSRCGLLCAVETGRISGS
jgi:threonylcarbamoyladenosine tRNA methylthiotransferase MtaB